jgi:hypothetical protein
MTNIIKGPWSDNMNFKSSYELAREVAACAKEKLAIDTEERNIESDKQILIKDANSLTPAKLPKTLAGIEALKKTYQAACDRIISRQRVVNARRTELSARLDKIDNDANLTKVFLGSLSK